jgi:hypothetical protein
LLEGKGERRARLFFNKADSEFLENSDFLALCLRARARDEPDYFFDKANSEFLEDSGFLVLCLRASASDEPDYFSTRQTLISLRILIF